MRLLITTLAATMAFVSAAAALSETNMMSEFTSASETDKAAIIADLAKRAAEKGDAANAEAAAADLKTCFDNFMKPTEGSTPEEDAAIAASTKISAVATLCIAYKKSPPQ